MTANSVILSGARVYYADTTATLPSDSTVAYGAAATAWGGSWKYAGYTNAPTTIAYNSEVYEVMTEQTTQAIETIVVSETATCTTSLIQMTGDNFELAFPGSSASDTPAGAGQKAVTTVKFGGSATRNTYLLAIEGAMVDAANVKQPVRQFFYRAQPRLNGEFAIGKNKEATLVLEWSCLNDESKTAGEQLGELHIITANASS